MDTSNHNIVIDTNDASPPVPIRRGAAVFRANIRFVLPITFIALIVGACLGIIPPWPVLIVLLIGFVATVSFVAAKKQVMGVVSTALAILVSGWLLRPHADIRAATSNDRIYDQYFGIADMYANTDDFTIKNIAVVTGTFTLNTWMSAWLYHVKSGEIQELNGFTVGRSPNQIGAPYWADMKITLALGDCKVSEGHITQLGSAGHSRGGGKGGITANDVDPAASKLLPGRLTPGTRRIIYVEGDSGFHVDRTMTVQRFAQENKGNYLVVEVEMP